MSSAWRLPEHIADVLPFEARRVEELRRSLLDCARGYGFELVMPPLLEHLDSLLTGTGHELDLRTFKLVDQLSGRTMGVRADTTVQAARIDAHLLNRKGVTRLCYCGPVLHTRPAGPYATREPLQFGAELFGHAGVEADLEVQELALQALHTAGVDGLMMDLADARLVRALLDAAGLQGDAAHAVTAALAGKDAAVLEEVTDKVPENIRTAMLSLLNLYGGDDVLDLARDRLPALPLIASALEDLRWLASRLRRSNPEVRVGFDLADVGGYGYYSGVRFAVYGGAGHDALARGGRYDEVGAVFGRSRPAVGFSLDLKPLAEQATHAGTVQAIRAPWGDDPELRNAVRQLRQRGETVVCVLPGHEDEAQEFAVDRELIRVDGAWTVHAC